MVTLFSLLLKITELLNLAPKTFKANKNEVVKISSKAHKIVVNISKNNNSSKLTYIPNIEAISKSIFLILNAKKVFNYFRQVFTKVFIL